MCYSAMQGQATRTLLLSMGFELPAELPEGERQIFPLQGMLAVSLADKRELLWAQYGLVPPWVDEQRGGAAYGRHCYNARSETIFDKPSFREAVRKRRAAIPVEAFFEFPDRENPPRRRFRVARKDKAPFWLAGVWEWHPGLSLRSCAVVTTPPMEVLAPHHSRSPLVLAAAEVDAWLDPRTKPELLRAMLKPWGAGGFELESQAWGKPGPQQGELFPAGDGADE